eukprot:7381312-Prymnesium_polylepis.1
MPRAVEIRLKPVQDSVHGKLRVTQIGAASEDHHATGGDICKLPAHKEMHEQFHGRMGARARDDAWRSAV